MKCFLMLVLMSMLVSTSVQADWDPELEAQEKAKQDAQEYEDNKQKREMEKQMQEMQTTVNKEYVKEKRKTLGAAATGKADAEVERLYDAKIKKDTEAAMGGAEAVINHPSQDQGAAAVQMTGKTLQELENMSDAEAEALMLEMEKKYGK